MSEKLKNLLSDIVFENEFSSTSLQTILKSCKEYQNFANKDASFISQINTNLNANINVEQNHLLLNSVIQQCDEELLLSQAVSWMSFCIKSNDSMSAGIQSIDYVNLYLLISKTHHCNDVKKQFVASILPKFILKLESVPSSAHVCCEKLKCLERVLKHYNGPCFSHYKSIERFLLQCIEQWHSQDTILVHIGLCHALLAQLGGGGHQTSLYRDNWQSTLCKLVKYGHEVLDSVFEDVPEIQTVPIPASIRTLEVTIPFPSYYPNTRDTSKLHASQHLLRAFKVLSTLIRTHLAAPFPAPKTVNIEAVLSVVARTLSITPPVLANLDVTSGHAILLSMLPDMHVQAHAILNTLITVAGRNLIPHSLYICKLAVHALKWSNTEETGRHSLERPFRVLRCAVYQTLHTWLTLAGYSSNIELMAEELVAYLLADVTYEKPPVTLTTVTRKTRKKHKTKVGLVTEKRPLAVGSGNCLDQRDSSENSVCACAHLVLSDLLKSAGLLLKPDLIKNIQTQITGLLLPLSSGAPGPPYSSCTSSRLALYTSLESLILYSHPLVPDLSHYASVFYHAGLHDSHIEIRELCQRGIEILEKVHHPKSDSLNFVVENLEEEKLKLIGPLTFAEEKRSHMSNGMNGTMSHSEDEDDETDDIVIDRKARVNTSQQSIEKKKGKENATESRHASNANKRKRKEKPDEELDEKDGRKNKKIKEASGTKRDDKDGKRQHKENERERQLGLFGQSKKGSSEDQDKKGKRKKQSKENLDESDDSSSYESDDDSDMSDDSDDGFGNESVAMMLMNSLGNNSDYDFEDDDSDDDDDSDEDEWDDDESDDDSDDDEDLVNGFIVHSPMLGGDSDDSLIPWDLNASKSSSESDDSRQGVVITEIVEETTAAVETVVDGKEKNERTGKEGKSKATKTGSVSGMANVDKEHDRNVATKNKKGKGRSEGSTHDGMKEGSENMDIDLIELDSDESSRDEDADTRVESKADKDGGKIEDTVREEITISSDSQEEDVIASDDETVGLEKIDDEKKIGKKTDDETQSEQIDDEDEDEEIDDCLKLFNAE